MIHSTESTEGQPVIGGLEGVTVKLEGNGAPVRESLLSHTKYCEGCLGCWDSEIAEREEWERGI